LRKQTEGEAVTEYVAALRNLAKFCQFEGGRLEEELLDQLVLGIRDDQVRKQLLSERDLTLQSALEICSAAERARATTATN